MREAFDDVPDFSQVFLPLFSIWVAFHIKKEVGCDISNATIREDPEVKIREHGFIITIARVGSFCAAADAKEERWTVSQQALKARLPPVGHTIAVDVRPIDSEDPFSSAFRDRRHTPLVNRIHEQKPIGTIHPVMVALDFCRFRAADLNRYSRRCWRRRCLYRGRDFAVWLDLVPRQYSTVAPRILGRISKRGSTYLRMLFIKTAEVIMMRPHNWEKFSFGPWLTEASKRIYKNKMATALANKLARIA